MTQDTSPITPELTWRRFVPLSVGLVVLVGQVVLLCRAIAARTGGAFCYPLDDTFIHMAIGRTIAQHGVFGVGPHEFSAASSSVLWPLFLAAIELVLGSRLLAPLFLNLAFGCIVVAAIAHHAERECADSKVLTKTWVVVSAVALAPLPTLVVLGMEHTAHTLASVAFVFHAARWLEEDAPRSKRVLVLAFLCTSLRYEALFLGGIVVLFALARRRYRAALEIGVATAAPIALFGLYALRHGGMFLPNSVVLKGNRAHFKDLSDLGDVLGGDILHRISTEPHVLAALLAASVVLLFALRRDGLWSRGVMRVALSLLVTVAHVEFASLNWFFRYEGYAITLLVANVGLYLARALPTPSALARTHGKLAIGIAALAAFVGYGPLARRALFANERTPLASEDIYTQQVQSALFLAKAFADEPVAVNDIGAVAYYGHRPIVDLVGLASLEVARAKKLDIERPMMAPEIASFTANTNVAIVYDEWFKGNLPPTWVRAGVWRIKACTSCAFPSVSIYATKAESLPRVVLALRAFAGELPSQVHQEGRYTQSPSVAAELLEGDSVRVEVPFARPDLRDQYTFVAAVGADGYVPLPSAPGVYARGASIAQFAESVRAELAKRAAKDPTMGEVPAAHVTLLRRSPLRYSVAGCALRTGEFTTDVALSAARAVEISGGPSPRSFCSGRSVGAYVLREHEGAFARVPLEEASARSFEVRALDTIVIGN